MFLRNIYIKLTLLLSISVIHAQSTIKGKIGVYVIDYKMSIQHQVLNNELEAIIDNMKGITLIKNNNVLNEQIEQARVNPYNNQKSLDDIIIEIAKKFSLDYVCAVQIKPLDDDNGYDIVGEVLNIGTGLQENYYKIPMNDIPLYGLTDIAQELTKNLLNTISKTQLLTQKEQEKREQIEQEKQVAREKRQEAERKKQEDQAKKEQAERDRKWKQLVYGNANQYTSRYQRDVFLSSGYSSYHSINMGNGAFLGTILGWNVMARYGGITGWGWQLGYGFSVPQDGLVNNADPNSYFKNIIHYSIGVLFYPYRNWYLSINYGTLKYATEEDQWASNRGFSFLTGYNIVWGDAEINGIRFGGIINVGMGVGFVSPSNKWAGSNAIFLWNISIGLNYYNN